MRTARSLIAAACAPSDLMVSSSISNAFISLFSTPSPRKYLELSSYSAPASPSLTSAIRVFFLCV